MFLKESDSSSVNVRFCLCYSLEGHLDEVREDVLGVQRDAAQVFVLLDEVEQLRGVGHPEGQSAGDVFLLL